MWNHFTDRSNRNRWVQPIDPAHEFKHYANDRQWHVISAMELLLQDDGNLVLLRHSTMPETNGIHIEWETETHGTGGNKILWIQKDGSLTLKDASTGQEFWTSYSGGRSNGPYRAEMPDPGWLKIVDRNGKAVWSADQT